MSHRLIETALDGMVNEQSVFSERREGFKEYLFTAYEERAPKNGPSEFAACASCGADLRATAPGLMCSACSASIQNELGTLAEKNGWPAHAVYEHEILYLASQEKGPVPAETLAAETRYTLRNMKRKLKRLVVEGFARQDIDPADGIEKFAFPASSYSKRQFRANSEIIGSYPASVMEEVELKTVRIIITLALMLLAVLVLAIMRIPFPLLMGAFIIAAPVTSLAIWRRRREPVGE
jgi:hypothetical protein